ncbi:hypothetical protein lerEdw1_002436 [Lerista edwardsae]|nr:hypothetical protein lerEdw1_002436 [Lerista edwardsae]
MVSLLAPSLVVASFHNLVEMTNNNYHEPGEVEGIGAYEGIEDEILGLQHGPDGQPMIQRSEIPFRRGYGGNTNSISADKGDSKNSSAHENRSPQNGNDGHQEGEIFLNLTKGYVISDEGSAVDALNLQEAHQHETESLLRHGGAGLAQSNGNNQHSAQESMGAYATFPIGKAVNNDHIDLITKGRNIEQNDTALLGEQNAVHGPVPTAEGSVAQEEEIFLDKQHLGGFQATSVFMAKTNVDTLYSERYHSVGNYHFSDEGMQGDDPGYADVLDSSQQEEDQSNSSQQVGEPDSPSSSNEGSKDPSTSKDSGSPNNSSGSAYANGSSESSSSSESGSSNESRESNESGSSSESSSSSDSNDSSSSSDSSDSSSSSDSNSSNDSSDSSNSSDSNDSRNSSNSSDSSSSSDSNDSNSSSDSNNSSCSSDSSDSSTSSDSNYSTRSDSGSLSDSSDSSTSSNSCNSSESRTSSDSGDSNGPSDSNSSFNRSNDNSSSFESGGSSDSSSFK